MRLGLALALLVFVLATCAPGQPVPTPLPTAIPPDTIPEQGSWSIGFQYEFPPGRLAEGMHRYALLIHCPVISPEDEHYGWHLFDISPEAPAAVGPVYLRLFGLSNDPYAVAPLERAVVHPDQPLVAVVHLVGLPRPAAQLAASSCELFVFWDSTGRQLLTPGEPFQP